LYLLLQKQEHRADGEPHPMEGQLQSGYEQDDSMLELEPLAFPTELE
jgi:hypothetical protein